MREEIVNRNFFVKPGYVCKPAEPTRLCVVVSSGVAVAVYDQKLNCGGLGHYTAPLREGGRSTAKFAAPAIVSLINMFIENGSKHEDLDAWLYGGSENAESQRFCPDLAKRNIEVGEELLCKLNVRLAGKDVGGRWGRKIVFNTGTGEIVVARVDKVRESDWYPEI